MIRFYANQAGYLPKGRKIAVLAQENRADEMEKMQDKKVSLWNEKGADRCKTGGICRR